MERKHKPSAIPVSPLFPQPIIDISDNILTARLPSHDTVTVNLYGATVTSWCTSSGAEQLFLSTAAHLNGSKPIRGGIPLVFPVFGAPPKNHPTSALPQHGFARNHYWEFLGKSSEESVVGDGAGGSAGGKAGGDKVKLDFGLSTSMLSEAARKAWPYEFGLVYSVTLGKGTLETGLYVQNKGEESFEFMSLFHSYLRVKDISTTTIHGLSLSPFIDKVTASGIPAPSPPDPSTSTTGLHLTSETDRVYTPPPGPSGSLTPLTVFSNNRPKFTITRDALPDVTVWNLWSEKAAGMADFEPKDGWKQFICVEPGAVSSWTKLEGGDAWEGSQVIRAEPDT